MRYIKFISLLLIVQGCRTPQSTHLKNINYSVCLDTTVYFPINLAKEKGDSIILFGETAYLRAINERKTYCCDLNSNVFRLSYRRAFHEPITIRVTPDSVIVKYDVEAIADLSVYNMTKLTENETQIWQAKDEYDSFIRVGELENADSIAKLHPQILDSTYFKAIREKMYEPEFVQHHLRCQKLKITKREFRKISKSINKSGFWSKNNFNNVFAGLDGSDYLLEVSTKDGYHFVYDWDPDEEFKNVCKLFLKFTDIKESDIY